MVHALEEIRRVLIHGGVLIDLRPLADRWPVQVVSGDMQVGAGRIKDLPAGLADDQAANNAIQEAARLGWFVLESELNFPFFYYWDSPEEMLEHIREKWGDFMQVEEQVYSETQKAWENVGADRQVRVQAKMDLTRWRKL